MHNRDMSSAIASTEEVSEGEARATRYFAMRTVSGTSYLIDTQASRLKRLPRSTEPLDRIDSVDLRRDGEWITILGVLELTIGWPAAFLLEPLGGPHTNVTVRETTAVVSIAPVDTDS